MSLSGSLLTKSLGTLMAVATPVGVSVMYKDKLISWYKGEEQEIKEKLGIPKRCEIPTISQNSKSCSDLTHEELKKINFENTKDGTLSVTGNKNASLQIEREDENNGFPKSLKFIFSTSDSEITIKNEEDDPRKITIKKDEKSSFKISEESNKLFLEKILTIDNLAEKIGFENCDKSKKECTVKSEGKINVIDEVQQVTEATLESSKKIKFEEKMKDYNQGFKFIAYEDITLTTTPSSGSLNKISKGGAYEVRLQNKKWFLIKKGTVEIVTTKTT